MTEKKPARVGDLLTQANLLRTDDLAEAVQIASETGQMIGKVLIMSGYLSKTSLQLAIDAQSMLRDNLVEHDQAVAALVLAAKDGIYLEEALRRMNWQKPREAESAKLGELLLGAKLITSQQLEAALSLSNETSQPLGSSLIAFKAIDESLLLNALDQQAAIREGKISKNDAIIALAFAAAEASQNHSD